MLNLEWVLHLIGPAAVLALCAAAAGIVIGACAAIERRRAAKGDGPRAGE